MRSARTLLLEVTPKSRRGAAIESGKCKRWKRKKELA
jgi:hypothetical protein